MSLSTSRVPMRSNSRASRTDSSSLSAALVADCDSATRAAFYQRVASAYNDPNAPTTWIGAPVPEVPVAPTGWAPSGTVRHDLAPPSLEWVQMRLNALGYANPPLTVDGLDGPDTQAAVRNFQTAKNLIVDGIAGPLTVAALQ